ncbi:hypothetical protein WA026_015116 [Henosepilachna vigintioctopunctata]|uniref:C2H2-type domain-containing protein n=1 Tax=Henosepilachna vigintioctopunctata TaxID=420089 RepID=A0AAW1TU13_9CUCU
MQNEDNNIQVITIKNEVDSEEQTLVQTNLSEDKEYHAVVLENVPIENSNVSKTIEFGYYNGDNSDGNMQINSEKQVLQTYILRETDFISSVVDSEDMQGYLLESEEEEGMVVEEYIEEIENNDEQESTCELTSDNKEEEKELLILQHNNIETPNSDDFQCDMCDKTFKTAVGLKRHKSISHSIEEVVEDDPLTLQICPCCGEPLDSNTHTVGDYKCTICSKLFPQQSILDRHTSLEHPQDEIYRCSECKFVCTEKSGFGKHLQSHSFKLVKCICNKEFTRKYHLERHLQISGCGGTKKDPTYSCDVCKKGFYRKDNLRVHMKAHSKKEKQLYKCSYCLKEFLNMALLNIHTRTHTGEKPYPCNICNKKFPASGALKKHQRKHTGEKPYECNQCGKRFAAKETLNRHIRVHTGDKPHSCQFCGKSFIQAAQLRAHIFHHTGENAYVCPYCSRAFNRNLRLTTHIKFMHEGADPLKCKDCDKKFFRKEDLARHSVSHSGERPFACDQCDKTFSVKSSLKIHKNTHNKEPPCSCEYCGRVFIRQDCLMRHMRARHRNILEDLMANEEKKRLQQQLLGAISEAAEKGQNSIIDSVIWNEFTLTESIKELLTLLVDEECLTELGYPDTPIDKVLDAVIQRCGHDPASEKDFDYISRMRENAKLLFTVVIDDEAVKSLLNNQTVDEVILHVLRLAKSNS